MRAYPSKSEAQRRLKAAKARCDAADAEAAAAYKTYSLLCSKAHRAWVAVRDLQKAEND